MKPSARSAPNGAPNRRPAEPDARRARYQHHRVRPDRPSIAIARNTARDGNAQTDEPALIGLRDRALIGVMDRWIYAGFSGLLRNLQDSRPPWPFIYRGGRKRAAGGHYQSNVGEAIPAE